MKVVVPERGQRDLTHDEWNRLSSYPQFWDAVGKGIFGITHLSTGRTRLHGHCFVGRIDLGDVVIECCEKIDGALSNLLRFATFGAFRVEKLPGTSGEIDGLIALLAHALLSSVSRYLETGRQSAYDVRNYIGGLAGGRLDITKTIGLRARGMGHLVAFQKHELSFVTELNQIILAALMEVGRLSQIVPLLPGDLSRARRAAFLFSDCMTQASIRTTRLQYAHLASEMASQETAPLRRDLLALAAVLLSRESFSHEATTPTRLPRTWFLNLESLFEFAALQSLASNAPNRWEVSKRVGPPVLTGASDSFRVHPDLLFTEQGESKVVGDVKYKEWNGSPAVADVYQLLVHASAFGVARAFLLYPGSEFEWHSLGLSVTGQHVMVFQVDVGRLGDSMARVWETVLDDDQ